MGNYQPIFYRAIVTESHMLICHYRRSPGSLILSIFISSVVFVAIKYVRLKEDVQDLSFKLMNGLRVTVYRKEPHILVYKMRISILEGVQ